jgi:cyclophilin family peptidyl-prolyl cis-trans isomerase
MKTRSILILGLLALVACSEAPSGRKARTPIPAAAPENDSNPQVEIVTSEGNITVELFAERAPLSTQNFLAYVEKKHYDNTIFHRVINDFMIQGGGFENQNGSFVEKETLPPVKNESSHGLKNRRGTIAMARTNEPDSATSQFFINTADNTVKLDQPGGYTVFGKVLAGLEVADAIEDVATGSTPLTQLANGTKQTAPSTDVPVKVVSINSIRKTK